MTFQDLKVGDWFTLPGDVSGGRCKYLKSDLHVCQAGGDLFRTTGIGAETVVNRVAQ
jgi:hypothetical protein